MVDDVQVGSLTMLIAEPDEYVVTVADPRQMSRAQLRCLGVPRLVYLRSGTVDGVTAYAIHAADGTQIVVVDDLEVAIELASEHDMTFVAVH